MRKRRSILIPALALLALVALVAGVIAGPAGAKPKPKPKPKVKQVGVVYTETNDPGNNQIVAFARKSNGTLVQTQVISTGGKGGLGPQPGCTPPGGCPILDTQGELALTNDGKLLFAVNAGSNTISSFRVSGGKLKFVSQKNSGGTFPNSLTVHGHLLYALNTSSPNIAGFRFSNSGKLKQIPNSVRGLTGGTPLPTSPRQIGFDNTGKWLVVTLLLPSMSAPQPSVDTFKVKKNGTTAAPQASNSSTNLPFGFAFDPRNHLVISQIHDLSGAPDGDTATYGLKSSGALSSLSTAGTNGFAPCWVAIPSSGRYAYVVNTGGGAPSGATVSVFRLKPSGALSLVQVTPTINSASGSPEFARTDETLSRDGHYLYVLTPAIMSATSRIDIYKVAGNGKLSLLGVTPSTLAPGVSGLVGR